MLTARQKQLGDFIKKTSARKGVAPSEREIARHFRISASTTHEHLESLRKKGYLQKTPRQARTMLFTERETKMVQIPLVGRIAAGAPIEAIENKETVAFPQSRLPFPSNNYYALRVAGNSMIEEDIRDGDVVVVKKQTTAENGQKVVALIDNSEATLKTFYKERGHIRLQPANKTMEPIVVQSDRDFSIQGIAVDVIRGTEPAMIQWSELYEKENTQYSPLPLNKIICGDAVQELRKLPSESVDIVIADPPYNIGKDFGNNTDNRELSEYVQWSQSWIRECIRVMKKSATIFIYGFSEILAHLSVNIPLDKRWLIWHYTNKNMASVSFWQRSHEAIICAWKEKPLFNTDEVREPYTEGFLNGAAGKIRTGKSIGRLSRSGKDTVYRAHEKGALPRDVLKIPALAGGAGMVERWFLCKTCKKVCAPRELKQHSTHDIIKHPTQKPLELTRRLIKSASPRGDAVVLVPFVGSGSECVAAKELGKSYVGFEFNPDYIKIAEKSLDAVM